MTFNYAVRACLGDAAAAACLYFDYAFGSASVAHSNTLVNVWNDDDTTTPFVRKKWRVDGVQMAPYDYTLEVYKSEIVIVLGDSCDGLVLHAATLSDPDCFTYFDDVLRSSVDAIKSHRLNIDERRDVRVRLGLVKRARHRVAACLRLTRLHIDGMGQTGNYE